MTTAKVLVREGEYRRVQVADTPTVRPRLIHRIDIGKLAPSPDKSWFNASLIRWEGKLLLCYRVGQAGSRLHIAQLDDLFIPVSTVPLAFAHPGCHSGQEDPRFFVYQDTLCLAFIGVDTRGGTTTHQMVCRLNPRLQPRETTQLAHRHEQRGQWEKNWAFFEAEDGLRAVYDIRNGHQVVRWDGVEAIPSEGADIDWPWNGGMMRGGASPVKVGQEYYHWFHGKMIRGGVNVYTAGLYTFDAAAPFRPRRLTPNPVLVPHGEAPTKDPKWRKAVNFPCGAILDGGRWLVSYGVHDQTIEIAEFDVLEVEEGLVML
jgi:predicted GH43/DUF377 family glycosyl hydrolase